MMLAYQIPSDICTREKKEKYISFLFMGRDGWGMHTIYCVMCALYIAQSFIYLL